MTLIAYRDRALFCDDVSLADIAAKAGTPCYVYSARSILNAYRAYDEAFGAQPHTVCYAVKANGNLAILSLLAKAGAGFDIVSGGELYRVLKAGGDPKKIVFSGVGKTAPEIDAALKAGIFVFNCESEPELALIDALAHRHGVQARVAMRVNPDVDAATHAYISTGRLAHKFGIDISAAEAVYERACQHENLLIEGSQLPYRVAIDETGAGDGSRGPRLKSNRPLALEGLRYSPRGFGRRPRRGL